MAIAAGVRFGAGYPITPWSDIMELLRRELPKYGGTFIQCEDEIASISMAIGGELRGPRGGDGFQRARESR
jgi:2-oxoglutarate ferredoxin oxidoreductase subunit alpha